MRVTTVSLKPCLPSSSTMYSMHGLPHSDTIGLGWLLVRGRRRVPSPPAMTTARTGLTFAFATEQVDCLVAMLPEAGTRQTRVR